MMGGCVREAAVLDVLRAGHWPVACGEELRSHVASCRRCAEVVAVKTALSAMQARDKQRAKLEAPGILLWRAQLRRRRAALEQATRPLMQAHLFAVGVLLVAGAGTGVVWWLGDIDVAGPLTAMAQGWSGWMTGVILAAMLLAAGTVAYFVAERD